MLLDYRRSCRFDGSTLAPFPTLGCPCTTMRCGEPARVPFPSYSVPDPHRESQIPNPLKRGYCKGGPELTGSRERQAALCLGRDLRQFWQQFGNNIGNVSPTWLQCCWQKSGDVTACHTSNLTVNPTCFQRHADGRRAGLKIRSSQEGVGSSPTFGNSVSTRIAPGPDVGRSSRSWSAATPESTLTTHALRLSRTTNRSPTPADRLRPLAASDGDRCACRSNRRR